MIFTLSLEEQADLMRASIEASLLMLNHAGGTESTTRSFATHRFQARVFLSTAWSR
jgi:hypothetical protein